MHPDGARGGTPSKSLLHSPFLLPFRSRSHTRISLDVAQSESSRAGATPPQLDELTKVRSAIETLLQSKVSPSEQVAQCRFIIDTLKRIPAEFGTLMDPNIATPLVSSLTVLCSRVLRGSYTHEAQLLTCELLSKTLTYAESATTQAFGEQAREIAIATGTEAVMPSHALSTLDRALLYRLVVKLHDPEDWAAPRIIEEPQRAVETLYYQLQALQALTRDGREILAFRGIIDTLTLWAEYAWGTMMALRTQDLPDVLRMCEQNAHGLVLLLVSACKFHASRLEKHHMEKVLRCVSSMVLSPRLPTPGGRETARAAPTRNAAPAYYGLEATSAYLSVPQLDPIDTSVLIGTVPVSADRTVQVGVDDAHMAPLKQRDVQVIAKMLHTVICYSFIPTACVAQVVYALCRVIGLPASLALEMDVLDQLRLRSVDTDHEFGRVLHHLLQSHVAYLVVRLVYQILCTSRKGPRSVRVGAILFLHALLIWNMQRRIEDESHVPLVSEPMVMSMIRGAFSQSDDVVDLATLHLVDDLLPLRTPFGEALRTSQAPQPLCTLYRQVPHRADWDVLDEMVPVMNRHLSRRRRASSITGISGMVLQVMVSILASTPAGSEAKPVAAMDTVAHTFWSLASWLPDAVLLEMVRANHAAHMYMPSHGEWLDHLAELVDTFYPAALADRPGPVDAPLPISRQEAMQIVTEAYEAVQDLPAQRDPMIERILVPLARRALRLETNLQIGRPLRRIVRHAMLATGETFQRLMGEFVWSVYKAPRLPEELDQQAKAAPAPLNEAPTREHLLTTRAVRSLRDLIEIFYLLAFGPSADSDMVPDLSSAPAALDTYREIGLQIFRELLHIVQCNEPHGAEDRPWVPSHLRLVVLRWLLRMRADRRHRLYFVHDAGEETLALVHILEPSTDAEGTGDALRAMPWFLEPRDVDVPSAPWSSEVWQVYHHDHTTSSEEELAPSSEGAVLLPVSEYLAALLTVLKTETDWDVISCVITHLPAQLSNKHLFCGPQALGQIRALRDFLVPLLLEQRPLPNVVLPNEVRRTALASVLYTTLKVLIAYQRCFSREQNDEIVEALATGLTRSPATSQPCARALIVACHELPKSFTRHVAGTLVKLSTIMSSITMNVHILELLAEIRCVPALYANLTEADYRRIFGIALQSIQFHESMTAGGTREDLRASPSKFSLSQYVLMLAYSNIAQWFMTLRMQERAKHASYITQGLVLANELRTELSDHTLVCLDFLARFTYSNAQSKPVPSLFRQLMAGDEAESRPPQGSTWLIGKCLITVSLLPRPDTFEITVRRPTGTVNIVSNLENLPVHPWTDEEKAAQFLAGVLERLKKSQPLKQGAAAASDSASAAAEAPDAESAREPEAAPALQGRAPRSTLTVDPAFIALQLSGYPGPSHEQPPILLPDDRATERLLRAIDLTPVYDFHKIGLVYVGHNQTTEREILGNTYGSTAYMRFLARLGDLVPLRDQQDVYTGGLDRQNDEHGKYAYVWRDNIKQVVFHTATLMPNKEQDPNHAGKKALIGNDWVHIVFNDSGRPYEFGTIPSQFNFVNVVITPHSSVHGSVEYTVSDEMYFHVSLQRRPGLPDFSPVGEGCLVSFASLPRFVCNLAMHSDLMSQIYLDTAESMVPYANNWVTRLNHVERFRSQWAARQPESARDASMAFDFTQALKK
ncbi:Tuberous sclerosis 2-like protein [Malassezia caprae]|uniref:Tuberous sclerosis 2-like protein n=1 Tax=Malassezia caprae TaxID=1381934 RepID=A0AAF0IWM9_9BASI|nr:Tuberous sclerosis 2-like protein [Malassezia caprae]